VLSCEKATDQLSAQLDGELTLRERIALRFHQFICSDCKDAAQNFRALVVSLRDRESAVLSPPPPREADASAESTPESPTDAGQDEYVDRVMQALECDGVRD